MPPEAFAPIVRDTFGRPLRSLRVSVTDRCNLRCMYCMPEEEYLWLPRDALLTFEELSRLVDLFTTVGVTEVRLTGGEPLLRQDLHLLVAMLAANAKIRDLALTTNGILLADQASALRTAGLGRVTVSLDTLRPDRFHAITHRSDHARVLAGLAAAQAASFTGTKIDAVILRGINDDELVDLIEFGRSIAAEVRFIEYMDVAGATKWNPHNVVSRAEMLQTLSAHYGNIISAGDASSEANAQPSSAPAERFTLPDGTVFGIIASTTEPFCRLCDRSRLTADGMWYRCLYATQGTDLRAPLRSSASPEEIAAVIAGHWRARDDRGAELRKSQHLRGVFVGVDELRRDPHLEMHTRGG